MFLPERFEFNAAYLEDCGDWETFLKKHSV